MLAHVQQLLFFGQAGGHFRCESPFICSRPCISPAIASGVRITGWALPRTAASNPRARASSNFCSRSARACWAGLSAVSSRKALRSPGICASEAAKACSQRTGSRLRIEAAHRRSRRSGHRPAAGVRPPSPDRCGAPRPEHPVHWRQSGTQGRRRPPAQEKRHRDQQHQTVDGRHPPWTHDPGCRTHLIGSGSCHRRKSRQADRKR